MLRFLLAGGKHSLSACISAASSVCRCAERSSTGYMQSAALMQSAFKLSGPPSTAQLQQQQTEQQYSRHQQQPAQQQQADHLRAVQADPALRRKVLVNRLLYRSRQRGFLEMDLLVGIWAEKQVPVMSEDMLRQFEAAYACCL